MLIAGELLPELVLNVDDEAVQLVNVLLETVKLLLLTLVSPANWLRPLL
jgi:hypothetical protein